MESDTLDLDEIERLAKAAEGYCAPDLERMRLHLTPARVLNLVGRARELDEERTARELMNSVMAGMAEHNARLERERDRLMAALLWLEGAKPGDWRRVSVHHESETGCLVCDLVRARNSTRCEFSRTESVHFASLMRDRVPLVVETIERFLREAEAVLGEKVEVSHEP